MTKLTCHERKQIAEILERRAREIEGFNSEYVQDDKHYGSVQLALQNEIDRLRRLATRVSPPKSEE